MRNLAFLLIILLGACTSTKITGTYKNPEVQQSYNHVFVVGIMSDQTISKNAEDHLVKVLKARKIEATPNPNIFTPDMKLTEERRATVKQNLIEKGYDSVLTFSLVSVEDKEDYVPGSYTPAPYYPPRYGYYGSYYGYYGYHAPQVYNPGYYTRSTVYTMEANLYDVKSEKLVWSARSETVDPTSSAGFAKEYAEVITYRMLKDGVLKRP
jgi:hypothetical protein